MDVNFSPAALCSVLLLSLASSAAFLEPCDLLYETAVQAFYSGDYSGVVRFMEAALSSYTDARRTRVRCRLRCQDKQPLDGSFSDLLFFDAVLRRAACMDTCIEEKLGAQSVHKLSEDVVQDFRRRIPYNYLQLAYQKLATSLEFLKGAGIIHTDLKPDNIMMVDHVRQPLKVKIIDFGLACNNPEKLIGHTIQCLCYRAPEILLRSLFDWAIDIWSLGCIVAELFMGIVLFPAHDENDLRNQILHMVGKPVFAGDNTQYCFWPKYWMESRFVASLNGLLGVDNYAEQIDLAWFIDLLRRMLTLEPSERITPRGILEHPFITMSHFEGAFKNSLYVKSSMDLKSGCQDNRSDDGGDGCRKILPKSLKKDSSKRTAKPPKSRRKRWRDGPGLDGNSSTKNRKMKLKQELIKIVKAMNDSRAAQSTSTQVH